MEKQELTFSGKVIYIAEVKTGTSAKGEWASQEFVVEEETEKYPQRAVFSLFGKDKISTIDIQLGDIVNVHFDLGAREYNGRWYGQNNAWKVDKGSQETVEQPTQAQPSLTPEQQQKLNNAAAAFDKIDSAEPTLPF